MESFVCGLDGTLVDSAELLRDVGNNVLVELGLPLMETDEARSYIGNGAQVFLEKMLRAHKARSRMLSGSNPPLHGSSNIDPLSS